MNTKYLFKGLCLASLTLGLASCQNDEIESVAVSTTDGSAITLNCVIGSTVESRAMIQLGNQDESAEYFLWNEGDVLWVKNLGSDGTDTDGETYKFEISSDYSDDNPSNTASFVCSDTSASISSGDVLCALYLGSEATEYTTTLSLDQSYWYTFEDYTDEEIEEHFKKNMYMAAKATYSSSGTSLSFEHLTTLIRISYVNETDSDQDIWYLDLSGDDFWFGTKAKYDEVEGTSNWNSAYSVIYNDFNDLTVEAKDSIDFYFLFFPYDGEFSGAKTFTISVNGESLIFKTSDMSTEAFEAGYRYWFDITKTDDGLEWTNYEMSAYDEYIEILSETNAALCEYLADELLGAYLDDKGNVWIPTEVVEATTELTISWNYDIETLNGLECFTNLENLYVYYSSMTSMDLSSFPNLYLLYCYNNKSLTSLDLSNNISLQQLDCIYNGLTSLDLSNNTSLEMLYCENNKLTSLDLSNNTSLWLLYCGGNEDLTEILCSGARLTDLDISGDTALTTLKVDGNYLSSLDICDLSNLTELTCGNQTNYYSSGEEQTLTLTLYEKQSSLWYDSWESLDENYNVELNIIEDPLEVLDTEYDTSAEDYKGYKF